MPFEIHRLLPSSATDYSKPSSILVIFCLFISCLFATKTYATAPESSIQTPESLYALVLNYLKQKTDQKLFNAKFDVQSLSKHIQYPACKTPLEIEDKAPTDVTGRNTLKVICSNPVWSVYMTATIEGELPVIMSTQGILKQAVIKEEDVKRVLVPYQQAKSDAFIHLETVIGMRAKRAISPNTIITVRQLQPPYWVFKDKPVRLVTKIGEVEIQTKGVALQDATEKEQVDVRNLSSNKKVTGIVIAPNTVWIP